MNRLLVVGGLSLARQQPRLAHGALRKYSSKHDAVEEIKNNLSPEGRKEFEQRLKAMEADKSRHAMPPLDTATNVREPRIRGSPSETRAPPQKDTLLQRSAKVTRNFRLEVYNRAKSTGLTESEAEKLADRAISRAAGLLEQKLNKEIDNLEYRKKKRELVVAEENKKFREIQNLAFRGFEKFYAPEEAEKPAARQRFLDGRIDPDPNAEKFFGSTKYSLNLFDAADLKPAPSSYWGAMERRKIELTKRSMGPTNAFEEQIIWTEQGKMWPYPIDNEYLMGEEEKVGFSEHIFLDRYLAEKHPHIPKTGPVAHFMELVCVGLSKNPYMTLAKKHHHLDSFAEFFNPEQIEKIHKLHEEAEKQAATA